MGEALDELSLTIYRLCWKYSVLDYSFNFKFVY